MRIRVAVAAGLLLLAGTSCGGDEPSPAPIPTVSASPSATTGPTTTTAAPTPTPTPPPLPALARQDSPAGAEAFARYWLTGLDYAYKTGNTRPFRALATTDCKTCTGLAAGIDEFYAKGGHIEGGSVRFRAASLVRHVPEAAALVDLRYSRDAGRLVANEGSSTAFPAEPAAGLLLTLRRNTSSWSLTLAQNVKRK